MEHVSYMYSIWIEPRVLTVRKVEISEIWSTILKQNFSWGCRSNIRITMKCRFLGSNRCLKQMESDNLCLYYWWFLNSLFKTTFRFTVKLSRQYREVLYTISPTYTASSTINIPHCSGTFVIINDPTLKHHHYPESTVHITVYFV
jgi:hypothetical protein